MPCPILGRRSLSVTNMSASLWVFVSLAFLLGGWFASAWHYKRKVQALRRQIDALRQTASEHANQARRQIGQLQAELAARPSRPVRERRPNPTSEATASVDVHSFSSDAPLPNDGFATTAILPNGFVPTAIMPNGFADTQLTHGLPDAALQVSGRSAAR